MTSVRAARRPPDVTTPQGWSTDAVPEHERLAQWGAMASEAWVPVRVGGDAGRPFSGRIAARRVGAIDVSLIHSEAQTVSRGPAEIDSRTGDAFFLNLPLTAGATAQQDGRSAHLRPGDFVIVDSRRPFELGFRTAFAQLSLTLPHELVGPRLGDEPRFTAVRVSGDRGVGAIASGALRALADDAAPMDRHTARALSEELAGLVCLALGTSRGPASSSSRALLLGAARDEIRRSLADPALAPATIAARLSISTRYLHRLFSDDGTSVARWLLEQRLQQCRRELASAAAGDRPVGAIAREAGFLDASYFARAFKARFGVTPSQLRRPGDRALPSP